MAVVTDNYDGLSYVLKANFAVFRGSGYRICSERYSMTFYLLFNVYFEKFDQLLTKLCAPVRFDNVTVSLSPEHARSCTNTLRSFPSEFAFLWPETAEVLAEATNNDFKKCMEQIKQNISGKHSKGSTLWTDKVAGRYDV